MNLKFNWIGGFITALIVGTILNGINQWPVLLGDSEVAYLQGVLTYCVPFFVFQIGHIRSQALYQRKQEELLSSHVQRLRDLGDSVYKTAKTVNAPRCCANPTAFSASFRVNPRLVISEIASSADSAFIVMVGWLGLFNLPRTSE